MRNLVLDTIEACREGMPAALLGLEVLGVNTEELDFKIDPVIAGPPHMQSIFRNLSVPFLKNTYILFSHITTAIEKTMRPHQPTNGNKKEILNYKRAILKGEETGAFKINGKYSLAKLVKVSCRDQSLSHSKPMFSIIFDGLLKIAS